MRQPRKARSEPGVGWFVAAVVAGFTALIVVSSCEVMKPITQVATEVGVATGTIDREAADAVNESVEAYEKALKEMTPEQEYYVGRSVGAMVLDKYRPYDNVPANQYLNTLGQTLAAASDRPDTFKGYHFLILDSTDINAFGAPGGLIFITRGMISLCTTEDALAAVLAHEIGHVEGKHGLRAISKSRLITAIKLTAKAGARVAGSQEVIQLTDVFEESLGDIASTMINNGYSSSLEYEADQSAVRILQRVGYDPSALVAMLQEMDKRLKPGGLDFAKTHPDPEDRIAEVKGAISGSPVAVVPQERQDRFQTALVGVRL